MRWSRSAAERNIGNMVECHGRRNMEAAAGGGADRTGRRRTGEGREPLRATERRPDGDGTDWTRRRRRDPAARPGSPEPERALARDGDRAEGRAPLEAVVEGAPAGRPEQAGRVCRGAARPPNKKERSRSHGAGGALAEPEPGRYGGSDATKPAPSRMPTAEL